MKSYHNETGLLLSLIAVAMQASVSYAFTIPQPAILGLSKSCLKEMTNHPRAPLFMAESEGENQVVELADDDTEMEEQEASESKTDAEKAVAPFLSQGEISEEALVMDWSDPKQQRVMFYIILSLLPVLFLLPLMLGSRELIPPDLLPPVQ